MSAVLDCPVQCHPGKHMHAPGNNTHCEKQIKEAVKQVAA